MSAHTLPIDLYRALATHLGVNDPGASGTIAWTNKGYAICPVVTAGTESRVLPGASSYPVGTRLLVIFKTDGGNLTITGSDQTIVLTDEGHCVEFVVVDNDGTRAWRVAADSRVAYANLGAVSLPADTATTTEIPATPDAADAITAFLELTAALTAAGVISDDFTQATS